MSKRDVFLSLEAMLSELPKDKRMQAAGALRSLRNLLGVRDEDLEEPVVVVSVLHEDALRRGRGLRAV